MNFLPKILHLSREFYSNVGVLITITASKMSLHHLTYVKQFPDSLGVWINSLYSSVPPWI